MNKEMFKMNNIEKVLCILSMVNPSREKCDELLEYLEVDAGVCDEEKTKRFITFSEKKLGFVRVAKVYNDYMKDPYAIYPYNVI